LFPIFLPYAVDEKHDAGLAAEFGVGKGGTLRTITASLLRCSRRVGSAPPPRIVGFDSFWGLPDDSWIPEWPKGSFSQGGVPIEVAGAEIKPGMFVNTVPPFFLNEVSARDVIRLVHVDCDIYSSTATALTALGGMARARCAMSDPELRASRPLNLAWCSNKHNATLILAWVFLTSTYYPCALISLLRLQKKPT
jgi:hypothetical protein